MPRLNIKSTKAAFVEELKQLWKCENESPENGATFRFAQMRLIEVAMELGINIEPEDFK